MESPGLEPAWEHMGPSCGMGISDLDTMPKKRYGIFRGTGYPWDRGMGGIRKFLCRGMQATYFWKGNE